MSLQQRWTELRRRIACANRQYRHNDDNSPDVFRPAGGFVVAYDCKEVDRALALFESELSGFAYPVPGEAYFVDDGTAKGYATTDHQEAAEAGALYGKPVRSLYTHPPKPAPATPEVQDVDCCVAAMEYALQVHQEDSTGIDFLRVWFEGDFDAIRKEWPDAPAEVFAVERPVYKPETKS